MDFLAGAKGFFSRGLAVVKYNFTNSKRKTFIYYKVNRKISNFKIQGGLVPFPMLMVQAAKCCTTLRFSERHPSLTNYSGFRMQR